MKYAYRVVMFSSETKQPIKSVDAYTSPKRAENACDRLNVYDSDHPYYGKVYYEVLLNE